MSDRHYYQSLTRSMVAWVVAVSLTPLLLCAAVLGHQFHTAYRAKVLAHLEELVLKHKQNINSFLRESTAQLRVLAELAPLGDFTDETRLARMLASLQTEHSGVFVDLGLVSDTGTLLAYAGPFRLGRADYAEAPWFATAKTRDVTVSDVFLGLRGLPHFVVAVRHDFGGKAYLLRSTIDFAIFNRLVENIGQGATGQAFIINTKGEFQTTPKKGLQVDAPFLRHAIWKGAPAGQDQTGDAVSVFTHTDPATGHQAVYVATTLKDGQWALVYQQDETEAFPSLYRARQLALLIVILGGLAIIVAAVLLARRMSLITFC